MLLRRPTSRQVMGASPARVPRPLEPARALRLAPQQTMLGLQAIQRMFTADDKAALFDFSTTANLYQNPQATTAAAVGSPVGRMNDVSGKGLIAQQATTANMPTLRQTPTTGRYWLESIDAVRSLNITTPTAYGTMYVGRVTPEGMVWTTENWSTTTVNVLDGIGSYSAGMVARGREFTAAEKALIEAYFARQLPALGPNLFANPGFDTDTAWTKGAGWTIANGVATKAPNTAASGVTQAVATVGVLHYYKHLNVSSPYTANSAAIPPYNLGIPGTMFKKVGYPVSINTGPYAGNVAGEVIIDDVSLQKLL